MVDFVADKWQDILFRSYQHVSLVVQSVLLATIITTPWLCSSPRPHG